MRGPDVRGGSGQQEVGLARLGALDERGDLVVGVDEGRTVGVRGLAHGDSPVGQFHGLDAVAAVAAAPGLVPAFGAEVSGGHPVVYGCHHSSLRKSRRSSFVRCAVAAWAAMRSMTSR